MSHSLHSSVPGVFMKTEIGIGVCADGCNGSQNLTQKLESYTYYRQQMKLQEVVFSQASVCSQGEVDTSWDWSHGTVSPRKGQVGSPPYIRSGDLLPASDI